MSMAMLSPAEVVAGGIVAANNAAQLATTTRDLTRDFSEDQSEFIIQSCTMPPMPQDVSVVYVNRPVLQQRIYRHAKVAVPSSYMVIVGPRGAGKSTVVSNVFARRDNMSVRENVIYIKLSKQFPTINDALKHRLGIDTAMKKTDEELLQSFEGRSGMNKPVLIVEVASTTKKDGTETIDETVSDHAEALKVLAVDRKLVHAILVLSDANAALKLKEDRFRQRFVWVSDFTADEANAYFDKRKVLSKEGGRDDGPNSKLRRRLLDEVGANPQMLGEAAQLASEAVAGLADDAPQRATLERGALEVFIGEQYELARRDLSNLLTVSPYKDTARRLMRLLLLEKHADGVSEKDGGFSADDLGEAVKRKHHRALCFNSETHLCQFYSKAHEWAARAWFDEHWFDSCALS